MQRLRDAAEMLFEPTGDLWKDYCAYCEIEDKSERDDLVDAIHVVEIKPPGAAQSHGDGGSSINLSTTTAAPAPAGAGAKVQTHIIARNLDYCLNKRDAMPLANAIPHCQTLTKIQLTGCGITEHSLKLFVEAVYKSPSVVSVALDFNPNGLFKDPTVVAKKDKNEVFVNPAQYRGNHLRAAEELDKKAAAPGAKGAADKGKPADPKAKSSVATVVEETVQAPIPIPTGFHAWLLTGIQQLSLRGNGINDRQVEPLCALLEQNSELLTLSLWGNNITSAGAAGIAKALRNNRRLTALNLGHNQIDDAGAEALAAILLTTDVSNEEAAKLRSRQLRNVPVGADLPAFPTYHDLFIPPPAADADKKDKKPAAAPPKKGKQEGPTEKLKGEFDRDCVRIDDNRVRVPGNTSLWGITLSDNTRITPAAATAFINVLQRREPNYDTGVAYDGVPPSPYAVPSLQLERVDLAHGSMPPEALATLQSALQDFAAYRAAAHSRAPTAQQ